MALNHHLPFKQPLFALFTSRSLECLWITFLAVNLPLLLFIYIMGTEMRGKARKVVLSSCLLEDCNIFGSIFSSSLHLLFSVLIEIHQSGLVSVGPYHIKLYDPQAHYYKHVVTYCHDTQ